jgi:hypothetical protein
MVDATTTTTITTITITITITTTTTLSQPQWPSDLKWLLGPKNFKDERPQLMTSRHGYFCCCCCLLLLIYLCSPLEEMEIRTPTKNLFNTTIISLIVWREGYVHPYIWWWIAQKNKTQICDEKSWFLLYQTNHAHSVNVTTERIIIIPSKIIAILFFVC